MRSWKGLRAGAKRGAPGRDPGPRLRSQPAADPCGSRQIFAALLNIARNAAQAIGQNVNGKGRILVRTRALTNWIIGNQRHKVVVNIEIEDDGPGIPPELGDSIFYPLVSGRPGGTGLGLPLAQELVSRHGGLIEFHSRPGQTLFMLRLPMETREPSPDVGGTAT